MSRKTATADKPYSPTKSQLSRVASQTNASTHEYQETVDFLKSQLQCADSKWRCYFKTLVVIEHLLHLGNERCVEWAMENLDSIRALELFSHADEKAKFRGKKDHTPKILRFPTSSVDISETQYNMQQNRSYFCFLTRRDCGPKEEKETDGRPEFRRFIPSRLYIHRSIRPGSHPTGNPVQLKSSKVIHENIRVSNRDHWLGNILHSYLINWINLRHHSQ